VKGQRDRGIEPDKAPVSDSGHLIARSLDPSISSLSLCLKRTVTREARLAHSARRHEASGYRVLDGNIGYLDLGLLASLREFERAFEALRRTDGLIVDIRRHPGFTMQLALASRLSDRPVKSAIYEIPIVSSFDSQEQLVSIGQYDVQPDPKTHYGWPVVVLVNEKTHGSAEDVCIYLKNAGRVTFVGGTTAGCNGNRAWLSLPGGGRLWFTGMRVKFGDGSRFQNIGITPDVPAAPTVEGIRAGKDEVLEKGIDVLAEQVRGLGVKDPRGPVSEDEETKDQGPGDKGRSVP
jgi:C-terminal processing protease CtpA/Prc